MSDPFGDRPFPKGALLGAAALIGFSIVTAGIGRLTDFGTVTPPDAEPRVVRELAFEDRADGSVAVYDVEIAQAAPVAVLDPGTNGFVRGVMRGMARHRKLEGVGTAPPFVLTNWDDGRLTLEDPTTGREVEINAFGRTQIEAFATLLSAGPAGTETAANAVDPAAVTGSTPR
ncbi:MAG: photosynthetic complex assembly protein PuhC [Azospirillaceae bacterium]